MKRKLSKMVTIIIIIIVCTNNPYYTVYAKNKISVNREVNNQNIVKNTLVIRTASPCITKSVNENRTISLSEALKIASTTSKKWDSKAELMFITSIDNDDLNVMDDGHDGNRRYWNFMFIVPGTGKQLILTIHDKKIVNNHPNNGPITNNGYIKNEEIKLTSKEAIEKCKSYYEIIPGQNWAAGYHFTLSKQDNIVVLAVVSLDKEGYFTRTMFNATTKQLISGIHKIPRGGGLFKQGSKINLNNGKQVSMETISISPNYANDKSMIVSYFINPYKTNMSLAASITTDKGINWHVLTMKDIFFKIFSSNSYSTDNLIYATTPKGLISTNDSGKTWKNVLVSQSYIFDIHSNQQKILVDAEDGLYISLDKGIKWNKLNTSSKVSLTDFDLDGNIYTLSNNKVLKKSNKQWIDMKVPLSGDIMGFKLYKQHLIAYSSDSLKIQDMKTYKWKEIKKFSGINNIFITSNNQMFCLLEDRTLVKLIENRRFNTCKTQKVNINSEGKLFDLEEDTDGKLYFCMSSEGVWEPITKIFK
ncbi:hypothetical protein KPL37_19295 [Clostridium frigoris]|uniref:Uncharacterized protein n=1 Tax=Clostridium frigoris TaxID=205327 RepID=A0ABS6BZ24_9CLOT|nr:hypothetical protein [Clostridium frigoris]MBU3161830.1 hypothetical protein [Clostridium frigoris]